jgi:hypothetical protein
MSCRWNFFLVALVIYPCCFDFGGGLLYILLNAHNDGATESHLRYFEPNMVRGEVGRWQSAKVREEGGGPPRPEEAGY